MVRETQIEIDKDNKKEEERDQRREKGKRKIGKRTNSDEKVRRVSRGQGFRLSLFTLREGSCFVSSVAADLPASIDCNF